MCGCECMCACICVHEGSTCERGVHIKYSIIHFYIILLIMINNLLPSGISLSLHTTIAQLTRAQST